MPSRPATENHPFGFGRERYIYAFIVSIVLFSVGGLFALYEAYHKYHEIHEGHPNEMLEGNNWMVAVGVLLAAIVMESFSFRTAIQRVQPRPRQARAGASSSAARRHRSSPSCCWRTSPR